MSRDLTTREARSQQTMGMFFHMLHHYDPDEWSYFLTVYGHLLWLFDENPRDWTSALAMHVAEKSEESVSCP